MTITKYTHVSSRPDQQVNAYGQPQYLPIPHLTTATGITASATAQAPQFESDTRFNGSDTYIDFEDDRGDDYDSSLSVWGIHTAGASATADKEPEITTEFHWSNASDMRMFCKEHDGRCVDTTPSSTIHGKKSWIDWVACIRTWKQAMPTHLLDRIDWSKVNPKNYQVDGSGAFVLID